MGSFSNQNEETIREEVKLAATAISLNVRLRSSDMPSHIQEHALRFTKSLLADDHHSNHRPNSTHLARALKKEFDRVYGPAWHCVVGKSFGSYVTHSPGGFVYFSIGSLFVLLFKTEVQVVTEMVPPTGLTYFDRRSLKTNTRDDSVLVFFPPLSFIFLKNNTRVD